MMPGRSRGPRSIDLVDSLGLRPPPVRRSKRRRDSGPRNRRVCARRSNSHDDSLMNLSNEASRFVARRTFSATSAGAYAIFSENPSMYYYSTGVTA